MITHLVTEVVIGIVTLMAGSYFWQVYKRDKFLMRVIHDEPFLSQLIFTDALDNPSPMIAPYIEKLPPGYVLNIQIVINSDKVALRRTKIILGFVVAIALVGSYFLGVSYFVINTGIFFLSALARVSQQARASAAQQILTLAIILDRWRSENATECDQWIKQAWTLRPLYDAVITARGTQAYCIREGQKRPAPQFER
jgi:hypothetical protein